MGNALTLPGNDRGGLNRKGLQFQVDELRILSPGVEEVVIRPEGRSHASLLVRGHRVMRFSRDHVANDPDTADTPDTSESRDIPIAFNKSASVQTLAAHAAFLLDSSPPAALSAVTLPLAITVDVEPGLKFTFRFALRGSVVPKTLTFVNVSSESELDSLLTTAFRSNPNIHLHPNVQIVEPELVKPLPQSSPLSSPSSPASDQTPPTLYEWAWIYSKPPSAPLSSKPFKNFWAFVNYDAATDSFQTLQYMSFYMSHPSPQSTPFSPLFCAFDSCYCLAIVSGCLLLYFWCDCRALPLALFSSCRAVISSYPNSLEMAFNWPAVVLHLSFIPYTNQDTKSTLPA